LGWVRKLQHLVERLSLAVEPEILLAPGHLDQTPPERGGSAGGPNIFIILGRDAGGFHESVARFIEQLSLSPVILAEQASEGRTLIEKFEANALDVAYAIALLTPEDSAFGDQEMNRGHNQIAHGRTSLSLATS
jgi:predicted nucleotide-binding protein